MERDGVESIKGVYKDTHDVGVNEERNERRRSSTGGEKSREKRN